LWLIKDEFYKCNLLTKAIRVAAKRYGQAEPDKSKKWTTSTYLRYGKGVKIFIIEFFQKPCYTKRLSKRYVAGCFTQQ
jgi:hypothetical protein